SGHPFPKGHHFTDVCRAPSETCGSASSPARAVLRGAHRFARFGRARIEGALVDGKLMKQREFLIFETMPVRLRPRGPTIHLLDVCPAITSSRPSAAR